MPTLAQIALVQRLNLAVHGVALTMTFPDGGASVPAVGIWHPALDDGQPFGTDFSRRDPRRLLEVALTSTVPGVPRGTTIRAQERDGGATHTYIADGLAQPDDPLRAYVIVRLVS